MPYINIPSDLNNHGFDALGEPLEYTGGKAAHIGIPAIGIMQTDPVLSGANYPQWSDEPQGITLYIDGVPIELSHNDYDPSGRPTFHDNGYDVFFNVSFWAVLRVSDGRSSQQYVLNLLPPKDGWPNMSFTGETVSIDYDPPHGGGYNVLIDHMENHQGDSGLWVGANDDGAFYGQYEYDIVLTAEEQAWNENYFSDTRSVYPPLLDNAGNAILDNSRNPVRTK